MRKNTGDREAGGRRQETRSRMQEAGGRRHLFRGESDQSQCEPPDTCESLGQDGLLYVGQVSSLQGQTLHPGALLAESPEEVDDLEGHELLVELVDVEAGDAGKASSHQLGEHVLGPEQQHLVLAISGFSSLLLWAN